MSYYGISFLYDQKASDEFGLFISDLDATSINKQMGSTNMEIYEQKIYRRASPHFYGSTPSSRLSFDFSAHTEREIDSEEFQKIQKWLFGSKTYKRFQIVQEDLEHIYWMAILNNPQITKVGNLIRGFSCVVECNSPFAFAFPKTTTYAFTNPPSGVLQTFYNSSDDADDYLYPSLVITMDNFGGDLTITNLDDNSRQFAFTGLYADEVITMDCGLQTLSSSTTLRRLSNFNKHFLRLVPGVNRLVFSGYVESFVMTTTNIVKKI